MCPWSLEVCNGGFCDTGAQYLHAVAQTCVPWRQAVGLEPEPVHPETKTRETQASWMRNIPLQTMKEGFTQMDKAGCHICDCLDVTKVPRNYKDSEQWEKERIQAIITIQKHFRRSKCIRLAHRIREYAIKKQEVVIASFFYSYSSTQKLLNVDGS